MILEHPLYGPPAPVPIIQWEDEFSQLLDLYRERKPSRVLEVGTFHGGTLYHWLQNAAAGATVVAVDLEHPNAGLYSDWVPEGVTVEVVVGDSHAPETFAAAVLAGPFDWVFIDAGHLLAEVQGDWENYGSLVRKGGIVAFHDINPSDDPTNEVDQLWANLRETHGTEEIIRGHQGGGIGVVHV